MGIRHAQNQNCIGSWQFGALYLPPNKFWYVDFMADIIKGKRDLSKRFNLYLNKYNISIWCKKCCDVYPFAYCRAENWRYAANFYKKNAKQKPTCHINTTGSICTGNSSEIFIRQRFYIVLRKFINARWIWKIR